MIVWESEPVEVTADEAMDPNSADAPRTEMAEATEWLQSQLIRGTPVPAKSILGDAREHGIAEKQLRKAAKRLGVVIEKAGMRSGWTWTLPEIVAATG